MRIAQVTLQGGLLTVESRPGVGSTFQFQLELPAAHDSRRHARPQLGSGLPPAHVLLVEDNPVNRKVAEALLNKLSLETDSASNGLEALAAFERTRYDLILMDVQMPGMDGLEATTHIRKLEAQENRRPTPILAVTANAFAEDRARCLEAGMDDFLSKPFRLPDLVSKLEGLLRPQV